MIKHTSGLYEFHIIPGINKSIKRIKNYGFYQKNHLVFHAWDSISKIVILLKWEIIFSPIY